MPRVWPVIWWGGVVLALWWCVALAEHTEDTNWTRLYKSADGVSCCNMGVDCKEAPVRILGIEGEVMTVEVDGEVVTLKSGSVHQSPTMRSFYCVKFGAKPTTDGIRCVFWAIGT